MLMQLPEHMPIEQIQTAQAEMLQGISNGFNYCEVTDAHLKLRILNALASKGVADSAEIYESWKAIHRSEDDSALRKAWGCITGWMIEGGSLYKRSRYSVNSNYRFLLPGIQRLAVPSLPASLLV